MSTTEQRLSPPQRRLLFVLGLPAFGIALAYTLVTTYVPVLLSGVSGPLVIGGLIGGEGLLALVVPVAIGGWSDSRRSRFGRRLPFVLAGAAITVAALVLIPLTVHSLLWVGLALGGFFVGYFVYHAPYYALYPDLVPDDARGRAQGFQGGLRSAGLLLGLAGGGTLLSLWPPLPFTAGAAVVMLVTVALVLGVRRQHARDADAPAPRRNGFTANWQLLHEHPSIRTWAIANTCWEAAIAALRTFVVLYFTAGLGLSLHDASASLALVGAAALLAAPIAGKLADRYGTLPVMRVAVWAFALGLTPPLLTTNHYFIAAIIPIAFAAVVLMTLPYTLLMRLLGDDREHGAAAGLLSASRGAGVLLGPLLAGLAIELTPGIRALTFDDTHGYAAIFAVAAALLLASTPSLRRIASSASAPAHGVPR